MRFRVGFSAAACRSVWIRARLPNCSVSSKVSADWVAADTPGLNFYVTPLCFGRVMSYSSLSSLESIVLSAEPLGIPLAL